MNHKAISQQMLLEYELLSHLESALRGILHWSSEGPDLSRKLSSMRFMTQSLDRHLERLMTLEEHDGYMGVVTEQHPELSAQVETLRAEHDTIRRGLRRIGSALDRISFQDVAQTERVSGELSELLERIDQHGRREVDLLQEAFVQEEGGQG